MLKLKRMAFFIFMGCLLFCCKENDPEKIRTPTIAFTKEGTIQLFKQKSDTLITSFDVEIAETDYETETGLMYRERLDENHAMFFVFPQEGMHSFYMKNTLIPLDIIFLKADSTIASFQKNAKPFDETGLSSGVPVKFVLEINAGLADRWSLAEGDRINLKKE